MTANNEAFSMPLDRTTLVMSVTVSCFSATLRFELLDQINCNRGRISDIAVCLFERAVVLQRSSATHLL
jgi:hypothetical protein